MDDNYLDEKLKGMLEFPPEFQPDQQAITDMQMRLRSIQPDQQFSSGRKMWPFLWWTLLLLLLCGGGYLYQMSRVLRAKMEELDLRLSQLPARDTMVRREVIYRTDTIYRTVYRNTSAVRATATKGYLSYFNYPAQQLTVARQGRPYIQTLPADLDRRSDYSGISLLATNPGSGFFFNYLLPSNETEEKDSLAMTPEERISALPPLRPLTTTVVSATPPPAPGLSANYDFLRIPKRQINPLYYFIPVGFDVGLSAGPVLMPEQELPAAALTSGLYAAIQLPSNRQLEVGGEIALVSFETNEAEHSSRLPRPEPQHPSDRIHELRGRLQYLQLYAGWRQAFFPGGRWQPYFSIGAVAARTLSQRLNYEYVGQNGEYHAHLGSDAGPFSIRHARIGLGVAHYLGNNFTLEGGVLYQHEFKPAPRAYLGLQYGSLQLGLRYTIFQK